MLLKNAANAFVSDAFALARSVTGDALKKNPHIDPACAVCTATPASANASRQPWTSDAVFASSCAERPQQREASSHRERIARERAGLVDIAVGREAIHDLAFAAECAHREPGADHFAQTRQVRYDIV